MTAEQARRQELAERFARLPGDKQQVFLERLQSQGIDFARLPIVPAPPSQRSQLSYAQGRQWFLWQLEPGSTAYHLSGAWRLAGSLDLASLRASLAALVQRHEALRTVFSSTAGGVVEQVIREIGDLDLRQIDLRSCPEAEREVHARQAIQRVQQQPFDLTADPLLRVLLLCLRDHEHVLLITLHHIIADGWSVGVLERELVAHYSARVAGKVPELPPLPIQYADYAVWQRQWLTGGELERQLSYWRERLGEEHPVLCLPTDRARSADARYTAGRYAFELPQGLLGRLRQRASESGASLFMVLLASLQALLYRYTGQKDVRVGVPVANRGRVETAGVVGFFVNTQVLRVAIDGGLTLEALLQAVKEAVLGAQSHQDVPFERLVEALRPGRTLSSTPLFQVMHNHQRTEQGVLAGMGGLQLTAFDAGERAAQVELCLETEERGSGELACTWVYAQELFDVETLARFSAHYARLLAALSDAPASAVRAVALLSREEQVTLCRWGDRSQALREPAVHVAFERWARERPTSIAVVDEWESLSYGELNARANRLAHHLVSRGVRRAGLVGLALERTVSRIVGLLAVLKAGCAYVPLDVSLPAARLDYLIDDSGLRWALTESVNPLASEGVHCLALDQLTLTTESPHDLGLSVHAQQLAYVIYTSGSSGRPKGAGVTHAGLATCMAWMRDTYRTGVRDTVLHKAPFGFDVSVWEICLPLTVGARLVLASPGDERDPARLRDLICRHGVTTMNFVPSMLQPFLAQDGIEQCVSLQHLMVGGEALAAQRLEEMSRRLPRVKLHNLYGPTETTIHVTHWTCVPDRPVRIGAPINGTQAYVLDEDLNLVPVGVEGELYIGGVGVGRGYYGRPGLTATRFVASPFVAGERLYRTGDRARVCAIDGGYEIDYLGRLDAQVKIRGFRIELGEVEARLRELPEIRDAVVLTAESASGTRLVAYVVGEKLVGSELRERLLTTLPDYMVPSAWMVLERLPRNANGKVDQKALPAPQQEERSYEAPRGATEIALAALWSEVLEIPRIGRHDNFFELGGHSLAALRLVQRARDSLRELPITLRGLFAYPTIAELVARSAKSESSHDGASMVKLNAGAGSAPPLVIIHDGWGSVLDYTGLAQRLADCCPVLGLPYPANAAAPANLPELARRHAATLLSAQPRGPYRLCGWSLGGALAPLVAAELERNGRDVAFVGVIDPFVHLPMVTVTSRLSDDLRSFLAILLPPELHARVLQNTLLQAQLHATSEDATSIEALVEEALRLTSRDALEEYGVLTSRELTELFVTSRLLARISRAPFESRVLRAPVTAWWSTERLPIEKERFAAWLGVRIEKHYVLASNHLAIVRTDELATQLVTALAP